MNGLHLMAELYGCHCADALMRHANSLLELCTSLCESAGLNGLGSYFHQFSAPPGQDAGVTGTVVLAESHLAIHTWPETRAVTLDIYVCNVSRDNSRRAEALFRQLVDALQPEETVARRVQRGKPPQAA